MLGLNKTITRSLMVVGLLGILVSGVVIIEGCVLGTAGASSSPCAEGGLTAQEAYKLIEDNENNADFVIIDLRLPQDFANEHIAGAININYSSETFQDELNKLDRNKTYLICGYCTCGGVGWNACRTMEGLGFKRVCNMWAGIEEWREEGLPTVKGSSV
jgi:rhodanese-related sulfurtransferase